MDRQELQEKYGIIGESSALRQALDRVLQVAPTDITVLLHGETGSGKDVLARAIHELSARQSGNLVIVNCGAIPEGIIESELFGHEKGAFTGAHDARNGYFDQAHEGTIFLDEVVDTPMNVQVKLLRVLESGEFFRVGSSRLRKVNTRVIAASNKDMWKSVQNGDFREDLYYRLNTVTISVPPLRERGGDILLIFRKFVSDFARKYDSVFRGMSDEARQLLLSYRWPGNIRELRNVAEQLVVLEKSQFVDEEVLKKYLKGRQKLGSADNLPMRVEPADTGQHTGGINAGEMQLIYRLLLDLRGDMNDLKKMLGSLFYNSFRQGNLPRSLPEQTTGGPRDYSQRSQARSAESRSAESEDAEIAVGVTPIDEPTDTSGWGVAGGNSAHSSDTDQQQFLALFSGDSLPSVEQAEEFLIKKALEKYHGSRRSAAKALGMSERTLYRKMDLYNITD